MEKFITLKGIAAPLPMINVDTDMIIPKQFLKTIKRSGLGKNLFHELRFDIQGNIKNDFVLNWDPYKKAIILIAGDNFGCGSSREHAPWSLLDFGFKCIIAPSFADIFYNNCFKNGILPIRLNQEKVNILMTEAKNKNQLTINLDEQIIILEDENANHFQFSDNGVSWKNFDLSQQELQKLRSEAFISYGSCSFEEPCEDLKNLGLL